MSAKNYTIRKGYTFFKGNKSLPHGSGVHTLTDQDIEGQAWKVEEVFPKTVAQKAAEDKVVEDARIKAEEDAQAKANLKAAQKEAARLDEEAAIAEENERQRIQDEAEEEAKVNAAVDETDADGQPNPPESEEGTDGTDEEVEEAKKKNVKKSRNRMVEPKNAKTK